jgi:hypothetical protein
VTPAGDVWVRRWSAGPLARFTVIDVFQADGSYTRTIVLPMDCATLPSIAVRGRIAVCMVVDADTGAESVVVAQLGS